jgi:cephalosporin-C deacetylase-like acetyl esterase
MRHADQPYAAAYPGLLTDGIESPASYVYRGIVADCCRVIDFLLSRSEVDTDRIAVVGNDLALFTAALRPRVDALYWAPALFYAACRLAARTTAYPLEEFNDFARTYPNQTEAMAATLSYFEPMMFAPKVRAATVLVTGSATDLFSAETTEPLAAAFRSPLAQYETAHSSYKDGVHQATWLAQRYGFDEPLLPPHWRPRT